MKMTFKRERGDIGVGMLIMMAAMMIGMHFLGGHMKHKKEKDLKKSTTAVEDTKMEVLE
ncbi:MAG: hypothetical protein HY747_10305 [Elusimicrobia bacterium]|nr:hypothetical protein [Elusimicrobiota bacterium]